MNTHFVSFCFPFNFKIAHELFGFYWLPKDPILNINTKSLKGLSVWWAPDKELKVSIPISVLKVCALDILA